MVWGEVGAFFFFIYRMNPSGRTQVLGLGNNLLYTKNYVCVRLVLNQ